MPLEPGDEAGAGGVEVPLPVGVAASFFAFAASRIEGSWVALAPYLVAVRKSFRDHRLVALTLHSVTLLLDEPAPMAYRVQAEVLP